MKTGREESVFPLLTHELIVETGNFSERENWQKVPSRTYTIFHRSTLGNCWTWVFDLIGYTFGLRLQKEKKVAECVLSGRDVYRCIRSYLLHTTILGQPTVTRKLDERVRRMNTSLGRPRHVGLRVKDRIFPKENQDKLKYSTIPTVPSWILTNIPTHQFKYRIPFLEVKMVLGDYTVHDKNEVYRAGRTS